MTACESRRREKERIQAQIWELYADLKVYRDRPTPERGEQLACRFDALFATKIGFVRLDRLLDRLHANRDELLVVLDHPEVPLNTNGAERNIRAMVTRRKLSGGTRSQDGKLARDTFLGLYKICHKLGLSFWDELGDRLQVPEAPSVPSLADHVRKQCHEMA